MANRKENYTRIFGFNCATNHHKTYTTIGAVTRNGIATISLLCEAIEKFQFPWHIVRWSRRERATRVSEKYIYTSIYGYTSTSQMRCISAHIFRLRTAPSGPAPLNYIFRNVAFLLVLPSALQHECCYLCVYLCRYAEEYINSIAHRVLPGRVHKCCALRA